MNRRVSEIFFAAFQHFSYIERRRHLNECFKSLPNINPCSNNTYSKRNFQFSSSTNAITTKRRRKPEPVILKVKSSKEILELYNDVSLSELCLTLKKDIDTVSELMLILNEANLKYLDKPYDKLDKKIILNVVAAYSFKPRFINRPGKLDNDGVSDILPKPLPPLEECKPRAPIVTIMGHVDHGKTTLLDALRCSQVAAQEFGGITQHIGAFSVELPNKRQKVTFLDTPGHSAFRAMRKRGAHSTDIVVLVVAADDGVKEQTVESIRFAREAGVPIVVAINKCDKPFADPKRTKQELMEHNVVVEDMGGDVQVVEISALQGKNLNKLQEALLTQAEIMDLKSTSRGLAEGIVIESSIIQGLGKVCTIIVNRGTLKRNTVVLAGTSYGRIKTMHDEFNNLIQTAGPSCPVRVSGWRDELPSPGDIVFEVENEQKAERVAQLRSRQKMKVDFLNDWKNIEEKRKIERETNIELRKIRMEQGIRYDSSIRRIVHKRNRLIKDRLDEGKMPKVSVLLRCDVEGTLEAILNVLETYKSEQAHLDIVDFGIGPPNEANVALAKEFDAKLFCFNVSVPTPVRAMCLNTGVDLQQFNVIYKLVNELKNVLSEMLEPEIEHKIIGEGHVLRQFLINEGQKKKPVAGCLVDWGVFDKTMKFRFVRKGSVIYEGKVESLKCEEMFVTTSTKNTEIGVSLPDKAIRFKADDHVEVFEEIVTPRQIDWNPPGF